MQSENWRSIAGYEGLYEVSDYGEVRSAKRSGAKGGFLAQKKDNRRGYLHCWLSKNGKVTRFSVHRLVATAFIPNPEEKPQVNHKDGNKFNNAIENLEWCTREENEKHKQEVLGEDSKGSKNGNYGYNTRKLYPSEEIRNRLCELGVPRSKHNLAELGEILPEDLWKDEYRYFLEMKKESDNGWYLNYWRTGEDNEIENGADCVLVGDHSISDFNEANARGKMLIYLLENKLITTS